MQSKVSEVVCVMRQITSLPPGAEREALVQRLAADRALMAIIAASEEAVQTLQGRALAT